MKVIFRVLAVLVILGFSGLLPCYAAETYTPHKEGVLEFNKYETNNLWEKGYTVEEAEAYYQQKLENTLKEIEDRKNQEQNQNKGQ